MNAKEMVKLAEALFPENTELHAAVKRQMTCPQYGPYHNEDFELSGHLALMFETRQEVMQGDFHPDVPKALAEIMAAIVQGDEMIVPAFIITHDVAKGDCLILARGDDKEEVSWTTWSGEIGDQPVDSFCQERGITQVQYYGGDGHAEASAKLLEACEPDHTRLIRLVRGSEMAGSFKPVAVSIATFNRHFGEWDKVELHIMFTCAYLDEMGSIGEDDTPDISSVLAMYESWTASQKLAELETRLADAERVNKGAVTKAVAKIRNSDKAFREEPVEAAYDRIVAECALPTVDKAAVLTALQPALDAGLDAGLADKIATEVAENGKPARETGEAVPGPLKGKVFKTLKTLG